MIPQELLDSLLKFRAERDWEQFHTAKNLSAAIAVEASELLEIFQWTRDEEVSLVAVARRVDIEREVADIAILLSYLCHDMGLSLTECIKDKLQENSKKYPASLAKGTSTKYDRL